MRPMPRLPLIVALFVTGLLWSACTERGPDLTAPDQEPQGLEIFVATPEGRQVLAAQMQHTEALMNLPGVVGTAVGLDDHGRPVVKVLAKSALSNVPRVLDGVTVEVLVTGEFFALPPVPPTPRGKPTCGKRNLPPCEEPPPPPSMHEDRPVPIGVSTGHPDITAGTIGARVTDGTYVWALSNNHVYAHENAASIKVDAVIQPGTFDGGVSPKDNIGTLDDFEPIVFGGACVNVIDAAIAATTTALVGNATPSGGYGTPRSATMPATVNMKVKKVGRTTGSTKGTVAAINATVNVGYDSGVACFTGQIIITPGTFSASGDSGSLIVVDGKGRTKSDDRRPVALLFAGSATMTVANPIDPVLTRFGVTIDGN